MYICIGDHVRKFCKPYNHHMLVVRVLDKTRIRVIHYTNRATKFSLKVPQPVQQVGLVAFAAVQTSGFGSLVSELAQIVEEEIDLDPTEVNIEVIKYHMTCDVHEGMGAIERARSRIGEKAYNLLPNNCETFVNWVKIERETSKQIQDVLVTMGNVVPEPLRPSSFFGPCVTSLDVGNSFLS